MSLELTIGFLGAGKMATALAKGFIQAGLVRPEGLVASNSTAATSTAFTRAVGGRVAASNGELLQLAKVVFLAVKPHQVPEVLAGVRDSVTSEHLLISIAAGIPLARLEVMLPVGARVIRVMPNTPALVGASASGFSAGKGALPGDIELAQKLLTAVGLAYQVKESLLDAVTGLSGSGPAYAYMIIEALSDGGVAAGLPREIAIRLAAQTLLGSAKMVIETGLHPGTLKDMVTSPGGTTIEGVHELEKGGMRAALISAVRASAEKAKKLGQA